MTHVSGYFNGAKWPIHLVISRLNITLYLKPGEYVLDRADQKINDPYLEIYADAKQLSRELSETPVPINGIPVVANQQPQVSANPVQATSKFELNSKGQRAPVMPKAVFRPPVAADANPIKAMSMDEARRQGLVRRVREVPEDYGDTDTSGRPNNNPPSIKYAIDPSMLKKPAPLPSHLTQVESGASNVPTRNMLIQQMAKSSSSAAAPESATALLREAQANPTQAAPVAPPPTPFGNQATMHAPADSPLRAGQPKPRRLKATPASQPVIPATAVPQSVIRNTVSPGLNQEIEPELEPETQEAEPVITLADEKQLNEGMALPEPELTELNDDVTPVTAGEEPAPPPLKPLTPADQFVCALCGAQFKFRSQLTKHARAKHPDNMHEVLAAYPEDPQAV